MPESGPECRGHVYCVGGGLYMLNAHSLCVVPGTCLYVYLCSLLHALVHFATACPFLYEEVKFAVVCFIAFVHPPPIALVIGWYFVFG